MRTRATAVLRRPVATKEWSGFSSYRKRIRIRWSRRAAGRRGDARSAGVHLELRVNRAAQAVVRDHAAHGAFDEQFRVPRPALTSRSRSCGRRQSPKSWCKPCPVSFLPLSVTFSALTTMTKSPVSTCGVKIALCLPRSSTAALAATRPRGWSWASMSHHLRSTSCGLGGKSFHGRFSGSEKGRQTYGGRTSGCQTLFTIG